MTLRWDICLTCGYLFAGELDSCPACDRNGVEGEIETVVPLSSRVAVEQECERLRKLVQPETWDPEQVETIYEEARLLRAERDELDRRCRSVAEELRGEGKAWGPDDPAFGDWCLAMADRLSPGASVGREEPEGVSASD